MKDFCKVFCLFTLVSLVSCTAISPIDNASVNTANGSAINAQATDLWYHDAKFDFGNYTYLVNNQWGSSSAKPGWWQAITREDNGSYSYKYEWWSANGQNDTVKGYPALVRGWHWGYYYGQGNGGLPKRIYENHSMMVSWKVTHQNWGPYESGNQSFDIWIGNIDEQNPANPNVEIMIWLNKKDQSPIGSYQNTVYIWGANWDRYSGTMNDGQGHSWQVISFLRQQNTWQYDNVNLSDFINYLWNNNLLDGRKYVCGIEAGHEIMQGKGYNHIDYYNLNIY